MNNKVEFDKLHKIYFNDITIKIARPVLYHPREKHNCVHQLSNLRITSIFLLSRQQQNSKL